MATDQALDFCDLSSVPDLLPCALDPSGKIFLERPVRGLVHRSLALDPMLESDKHAGAERLVPSQIESASKWSERRGHED